MGRIDTIQLVITEDTIKRAEETKKEIDAYYSVIGKAKSYALQWHLSDYPSGNLSGDYQEIIARIKNDEIGEDILPWADYEDLSGFELADRIETMVTSLIKTFGENNGKD